MFPRVCFIILFALAMIFSTQALAAQESKRHEHNAPHGGVIQEADGYVLNY